MKIAIIGPGAMGTLLAALFTKAKEEVFLIDKNEERAKKINEQGVFVEGLSGDWPIKIKTIVQLKDLTAFDLLILCVKSYYTKEAISRLKPIIKPTTYILTLQNGIGNIETMGEIINSDQIIGGTTNLGATLLSTGKVRFAGKGETIIGKLDGKIPVEMRAIRELFNKAHLELKISRDIKGLLWSKLIINVGINALTALTRLPNGKLIEYEGTRRIMRDAVTEALRVAKRKRIKLLYDDPLAKVEAVCEATSENVSSMLQDILRKKRTEIDFINGVIVRQAQELGIPAITNRILLDLVKTVEASYAI